MKPYFPPPSLHLTPSPHTSTSKEIPQGAADNRGNLFEILFNRVPFIYLSYQSVRSSC